MKRLFYGSIALLGGSCAPHSPASPPGRFYDFNIEVSLRHPVGGLQERYILANLRPSEHTAHNVGWNPGQLRPHTLHVVKYATSTDARRRPVADPRDTLRIELRRGQMDTLYALTTALFAQPGPQNLTPGLAATPGPVSDELSATVDFNLGPGGNRYKAHVPAAAQNFALSTYLKRIVIQHRRRHPPIT
ncbi:hypothetical protein [Hymenobacter chitinivorans]|uniref:Uncharacterized protein n=1 Tax=Hymenobacter chitinivorans DSM 11115 TaxID=1121954 RepID=A0A2M9BMC0_9BACT|nr:hypothetical protein [Hymenobacter chitinivorans]PJJ59082.1 hypothetical protein CLV45_0495 [Hymenobacter chitinivorans DSM 11115]